MPFTAALSTAAAASRAVDEICAQAQAALPGAIDLALVFYSPHHASATTDIVATLHQRLAPRCLLGCPGETIIGKDREIEDGPAMSLWLGRWSDAVRLTPFHLTLARTPEGHSLLGWPDELEGVAPEQALILMMGDPFSFPADGFLHQVNEDHPGLRVVGGMGSGVHGPGECGLLYGTQVHQEGAVGLLLQGPLRVRSVVSQGCRPIGRHMVITKAQENIIAELGGKPALAQLQQLWQESSPADRELMQQGLHVGRVINEYQDIFQRGDFLVRNVIGMDRSSGAIAITDRVRVGQTVQFHVRDAATADEDLHALLQMDLAAHEHPPTGALLFSCNGRGTRLFPQPHHDAQVIRAEVPGVPLAGFFAQGEMGPVGGQNFLHGFTASVVLFEG